MQQWKKWTVAAAMTALLLGSTSYASADDLHPTPLSQTEQDQAVDHHSGHHQHDGKHKLSPEQKAALKKAGIDPKEMKATQQEIRMTLHNIRDQGHTLHELVQKANDDKLKAQVRDDLESFRTNMRQAHQLHKANRDLHDQFLAAIESSDTAKIKDLFHKMEVNQQQELKYVQAAEKAMQEELKKVQGQVKS